MLLQIYLITNKKKCIDFNYSMGGENLKNETCVKDLGVWLTSTLSFSKHIRHTVSKSMQMLGFIKRSCKSFTQINVLRSLYISLVRSQLEYCCQIWSPHHTFLIHQIEVVQRKFLRFLCFKAHVDFNSLSYAETCKYFNLPSLEHRRLFLDGVFLFKCVNSVFDCPYLVEQMCFLIPGRNLRSTRSTQFYCQRSRLNVRKYSILNRIQSDFSSFDIVSVSDMFYLSLNTFKARLKNVYYR